MLFPYIMVSSNAKDMGVLHIEKFRGNTISEIHEQGAGKMNKTFKTMMMLMIMLLAAGGGFAYSSQRETPMYSLQQAQKAFERHDSASFNRYVDVRAIMGSFYDHMFEAPYKELKREFEDEKVEKLNGDALVALMKPCVTAAATRQFIDYVENRKLATEKETGNPSNPEHALLAMWRESGGEDVVFDGIEYIGQEGRFAHAWLKVRQKATGKTFVLDIAMKDRGGYWQVSDVWNFAELLRQKSDMEHIRTAEREMLIAAAMQRMLVLEDLETPAILGRLETDEGSAYGLELTNRGQEVIDEHAAEIILES
jgi:hypothetical protein